ncbi:MAG: 16S rRNA (guanine(527)-N(7))-methyltransferase RsmG [Alphaproteobacteria bacterium]|nr:16S rRNA (guanine(527)-N(7))-methyltransferase RsmG [Alphaproteobacteria bacterium]
MKQLITKIEQAIPALKKYENFIHKWQKAINLVSKKDIEFLWERHILDSAQVYFYLPVNAKILIDFGSGGGFPALVIAILNKYLKGSLTDIYLIESDIKKCVFLQEVARELNLSVHIVNDRIEKVKDIKADIITARGFASVKDILTYSIPFLQKNTEFLLLKGIQAKQELKNTGFSFNKKLINSCLSGNGYIVYLSEVKKNA